jgi:hypothetical protein
MARYCASTVDPARSAAYVPRVLGRVRWAVIETASMPNGVPIGKGRFEMTWTNRQPGSPLPVPARYRPLHKYLLDRYADVVVLRFTEIEDLLGFALPELARAEKSWWAAADADGTPAAHCRSWTEADRTATPNLLAQTVAFERAAA